jgi:two-component system, NtrC family, C4-dicarboxylate transport sensor histidine kinase DctB
MSSELAPDDLISLNRLTTVARTLVGTAHALNNALQVIAGSAELLTQQKDLGDGSRRAVDRIQQQTARAAETLSELMQFARDAQNTRGQLALRAIAAKAVSLRAFSARRAGLTLSFDTPDAVSGTVHGRPGQLLQVVLNLIMNAEQALAGRPGGTIAITLSESADCVNLTVTDNGPGVAPEIADRLFTAFVSGHSSADTHGLGLAAARAIARQHGGDVSLVSVAEGCRVTLSLPKSV